MQDNEAISGNALCSLISTMLIFALLLATPRAQAQADGLELSAGASSLIVLGPLSGQASAALDATVSGPAVGAFAWSGGARLGVGGWSSEVFGRFSAALSFGAFLPAAGIELGLSARGDDDSGERLLSDGRSASREGLSPVRRLHRSSCWRPNCALGPRARRRG